MDNRTITASEVARAIDRTASWLRTVWRNQSCGLHAAGAPSLMPTCFAVLASECCGLLENLPEDLRESTTKYIRDAQIEQSGLFDLGPIQRSFAATHSATYLRLQASYFALHALDALGATSAFQPPLVEHLRSRDYATGWLDGGPWSSPWLHSNNVMFALTFLQVAHARTDDREYLDAFDGILDYLDQRQDSITGLWQPDGGRNDAHAVYGAYHFFPFYFWRGRCPAYVERIIDTTLGIQEKSGFYVRDGGACEDLDAVHTLVMMSLVADYRSAEVRDSLFRCARTILEMQSPDGGFTNFGPRRERIAKKMLRTTGLDRFVLRRRMTSEWCYSGWPPLSCPLAASDMWGSWFRPLALRLIAERYADAKGLALKGRYRHLPGLGWHDAIRIQYSKKQPAPAEVGSNQSAL